MFKNSELELANITYVGKAVRMCGIDFFTLVWFQFSFLKKLGFSLECVWFGSVETTWFSLDIIVIYYSCNNS